MRDSGKGGTVQGSEEGKVGRGRMASVSLAEQEAELPDGRVR